MTEEVSKVVDGFFDKLTEATEIISTKLIEITPDAAVVLLHLVQFKGVFAISKIMVMFLVMGTLVLWSWRKFIAHTKKDDFDVEGARVWATANILGSVSVVILFCATANFYNWISAVYPEGAIAFKALEAVGINL